MAIAYYVVMCLFIIICLMLIGVVLIQKGRGGGMSGAFGGGGGNTAFGTKTGDVLTWVTSIMFALFILILVSLNLMADKMSNAPTNPGPSVTPTTPAPTGSSNLPNK